MGFRRLLCTHTFFSLSMANPDRRKVVHQLTANVIGVLDQTQNAIDHQAASSALTGWPYATSDVSQIQSALTTHKAALESWYTTWRGSEAAYTADPAYLGVFGTVSAYKNNLKDMGSIPRLSRNDYAAMSLLAMAYEELYSVAVALKEDSDGLKPVALSGLQAIIGLVRSISETVCTTTVRKLHNDDSTIPMSHAQTAITATQNEWGW